MVLILALTLILQVDTAQPTLLDAALEGRETTVKALLAKGAKVDEPDESGMTPLMVAAAQGHTAVARALMTAGANVNAVDRDAITALMRAAASNRVDTVAALLAGGANPNARTKDGSTALTAAAFGGYDEVVTTLLEHHAEIATDQQGRTPLMAASMNGHAPVVRVLLARGAGAQAADAVGATALRYAAARGHADVVELLAAAGGSWGDPDLTLAAEGCHAAVLDLLLKKGGNREAARDGQPLLMMAASAGCTDAARVLVSAGADVNGKDGVGRTPLMVAAASGSRELVQLLLARGANRNAMDNLERTPAMFAALSRQDEVIALLENAGPAQRVPVQRAAVSDLVEQIVVESPTVKPDQPIPREYTADGRNMSPPLTWRGVPAGARQLAVVCEDPDAGNPPPFVHWVIYRIPATATGLPENIPFEPGAPMPKEIGGAIQGLSGFRRPIYRGPAPPAGKVHHYHFIVYALDADLDLKPGLTRADLLSAIQGHVIGQGELVATYERK